MGHRHIFSTAQLADMENDRDRNHTHPDPRVRLENGSFIFPVDVPMRSNGFPPGNFHVPTYRAANTRLPHDPYLHASSSSGNSSQAHSYIHHGPPCYNQFPMGANPQIDYGRAQFKRKSPSLPMAFDAGSSSSLHVPTPIPGPQFWPMDYGSNNLLIPGEESQRNVRSRHSHHTHHTDLNTSRVPPYVSGPTAAGQWSHTHSTPIPNRHPSTTLPVFYSHISHHDQRNTPYRALRSYRPLGYIAEDGRRVGVEGHAGPSRHSRPLSIPGQRGGERIERARNFNDDSGRNRWVPDVAMMNRLTFYDSRNFFDQHRDMRLDIDNMSYEELLALGERIGTVKTGLSEDTASECMTEMIYSPRELEEQENCVICLEEYKERESLSRLRCGHNFHHGCIKKWLVRKNVCPICKSSAVEDVAKEE